MDRSATGQPLGTRDLHALVHQTQAHRLNDVTKPPSSHYPLQLLHEDEHHQQLRRCLTDESLPLTARIIGSLIRLYGVQIPRMVELTVDKFLQDESGAYLTINANPVLLPPRLAQLIERHIAQPPRSIHHLRNDEPRYLFPGSPPSRPRNPEPFTPCSANTACQASPHATQR